MVLAEVRAYGLFYQEPLVESRLNDILLEWKNKELPEVLRKADSPGLEDLLLSLERCLLRTDLKINKLKDHKEQDQLYALSPRARPALLLPFGQTETELLRLFQQRKAIVMALMDMVKRALAPKR